MMLDLGVICGSFLRLTTLSAVREAVLWVIVVLRLTQRVYYENFTQQESKRVERVLHSARGHSERAHLTNNRYNLVGCAV